MKNFVLLLTFAIAIVSCKKSVDALPEATQTGANTFGARLDGRLWVPQKFGIVPTSEILEARYTGTGGIFINARDLSGSPTETEFEIYLQNVSGTGTILLNQNTNKYPDNTDSYAYYVKRRITPQNEWITGSRYTGSVTVTRFDRANNIISGSFEFTAGSIDSSAAPISVTEGRFDVKIQ